MRTLIDWLDDFDKLASPGPYSYDRVYHHVGGEHGFHLVIGSMVHGDEVGSLPAVVQLITELASGRRTYGGTITFFVGNPEAGLADERFLESDLNRVFMDEPPDTHEGRRARLLRPILDDADVFLDLHQTILETKHAFYIFPFQEEGWLWASALGTTPMWVTRHPGSAFSTGAMCADEYVRHRSKPGITIELSHKGFGNGGEVRAYQAIGDAMILADNVAAGTTTLRDAAFAKPELTFLHTTHREPFATDAHALKDGVINFSDVTKGDVLSAPGTPEMVAPGTGMVLFPKFPPIVDGAYKKPLPGEIYRIVEPLPGHPLELYADDTHAE